MLPEGFAKIFVENAPDALIATSPEGRVLAWNRGAEKVFGYTSEEAVGCPLHDLIGSSDQPEEVQTALRQSIESDTGLYEAIRRRKDGSLLYVDVTHNTVRDAQGNIEFIITCEKDITRLKVLRDARVVETRFRGLLEFVPDAIVMVNYAGRIVLVNSQAASMFGYDRDDLLGQPVEILLPVRYQNGHVRFRTGYVREPRTRAMGAGLELYGLRRDGHEFPGRDQPEPAGNGRGRPCDGCGARYYRP